MTTRNWRDNADSAGNPPPRKQPSRSSNDQPMQLGPIVRAGTLVVTLVAIAFCGKLLWDNIQPKRPTIVYVVDSSEPDFTADSFSAGLYLDESAAGFGVDNEHLKRLTKTNETTTSLGPKKNTALFFLHGDLLIDDDQQIQISQNQLNSKSRFEASAWTPLRRRLETICASSVSKSGDTPITRVVFLDIGEFDSSTRFGKSSLTDRINNLVVEMKADSVANVDRMWILASASDGERSWFAPELGSSVFSYFVLRGMDGWAVSNEEPEISLPQLVAYVENSVSRWVRDFRDSNQTPQLFSGSGIEPKNISIVFSNGAAKKPEPTLVPYHQSQLGPLWKLYLAKQQSHPHQPHLLATLQTRLIRLEEARYGADSGDSRSRLIFKKIKLDIEERLRQLRPERELDRRIVSLEQAQITIPDFEARVVELQSFLIPKPAVVNPADSPDAAPPAAKPPVLSESIQKLNRAQRLTLVWRYLASQNATNDNLTATHLKNCLELIETSAGNTSLSIDEQTVEWMELQFLRILVDNIDWATGTESAAQVKTALAAISVRQESEQLILGFKFNPRQHARTWPLVRDQFINLEISRRLAEDRLLANQYTAAQVQLKKLLAQYQTLEKNVGLLIETRSFVTQTQAAAPHLRRFLVEEAMYRETSLTLENRLEQLNAIQRLAFSLSDVLRNPNPDLDFVQVEFKQLSKSVKEFKSEFAGAYLQRLISGDESASDVVFQGLSMLASPIPEWLADQPSQSQRETIRTNVDKWISVQHQQLLSEWSVFHETQVEPPARTNLSADAYQRLVQDAPQSNQDENLGFVQISSVLSIGNHLAQFKIGGKLFEDLFSQRKEPIANGAELATWQSQLADLDVEIRQSAMILGAADRLIDVGPALVAIDEIRLAADQSQRAADDCWGAGLVKNMANNHESPPFVIYAKAFRGDLQKQLERLGGLISRVDKNESAFELSGLSQDFDQQLAATEATWAKLIATSIIPSEAFAQPSEFNQEEQVTVANQLKSELAPSDVGQTESLTMSTKLQFNLKTIQPTKAFDFDPTAPEIPHVSIPGNQLSQSSQFESQIGFRGNRFKQSFLRTRKIVAAPPRVTYVTTIKKLPPRPAALTVINSQQEQADIVFVLDCSNSMREGVTGKTTESGTAVVKDRFYFAKTAMKTAIRELGDEKRFRFCLYAFGHRVGFKTQKNKQGQAMLSEEGDRYAVTVDQFHPFDDCERLYALGENDGKYASLDDIQNVLERVDDCKSPAGITPLYYSIKEATKEFAGAPENRKRYIVVLTDGNNQQFEGIQGDLACQKKSVPRGKTIADATLPPQVLAAKNASGAQLFVARISKGGETQGKEQDELREAGADRILSVNQDNSESIANAILDAIGRNEFTLNAAGESNGDKHKMGETLSRKGKGIYVVRTVGVRTEDEFEIELDDGVSVKLENQPEGLTLADNFPPMFVGNSISCNLADGSYKIGRTRIASQENVLAFGFNKSRKLAGAKSDNFSFRPQRIWAQVIERSTGIKTNLFLPTYGAGQYPESIFALPPKLAESDGEFDVRLWIAPSLNDRGKPILDPMQTNAVGIGKTVNNGITCLLERDDSRGVSSITTTKGDDPRDFFVNGPAFKQFVQKSSYINGKLENKTFEFTVPASEATFSLSVLPLEDYQAIMKRVESAEQEQGKDQDPIFGDPDSVWILFKNLKLN